MSPPINTYFLKSLTFHESGDANARGLVAALNKYAWDKVRQQYESSLKLGRREDAFTVGAMPKKVVHLVEGLLGTIKEQMMVNPLDDLMLGLGSNHRTISITASRASPAVWREWHQEGASAILKMYTITCMWQDADHADIPRTLRFLAACAWEKCDWVKIEEAGITDFLSTFKESVASLRGIETAGRLEEADVETLVGLIANLKGILPGYEESGVSAATSGERESNPEKERSKGSANNATHSQCIPDRSDRYTLKSLIANSTSLQQKASKTSMSTKLKDSIVDSIREAADQILSRIEHHDQEQGKSLESESVATLESSEDISGC